MRILIFHGYLLGGTGSNVYNARLAAALSAMGVEVHLFCQDRTPAERLFVDAVGDWDSGELRVRTINEPVRCTVYRPNIGTLLPVYVLDRYEGIEARTFADIDEAELDNYLARNVAAVGEVARLVKPDIALANHLVMGPVILARALEPLGIPYAVKVHGSALEYTVKPQPERFLPLAREGIASARGVLVGSRHTAESLWAALDDDSIRLRTRLGPPGVDIDAFAPRSPQEAADGLVALAERLSQEPAGEGASDSFARADGDAGRALQRLRPGKERIIAYTGKLIVSKGVDLLLAAWPLVLERVPEARLVVVGFGAYRETLERMASALAAGDVDAVRQIALAGRELEGGPAGRLEMLLAFLDSLDDADRYWAAAAGMDAKIVWAGRLDHDELAELLPACEAQIVPSTFPESFGMVAVEAAACGALPIAAAHSGLQEVSRTLAAAVPAAAPWLSFELGGEAVESLAERLCGFLQAPAASRASISAAIAAAARERYSWQGVARGVLAAASGELDELLAP